MAKQCLNCNKTLLRHQYKYCSTKCQQEHQYIEYIRKWQDGLEDGVVGKFQTSKYIRRYLYEKYGSKCCQCGWCEVNKFSNTIPLEIEHIDGNFLNNNESNLLLLCPNCHSLTSTYKALNKGNGRKGRSTPYDNLEQR